MKSVLGLNKRATAQPDKEETKSPPVYDDEEQNAIIERFEKDRDFYTRVWQLAVLPVALFVASFTTYCLAMQFLDPFMLYHQYLMKPFSPSWVIFLGYCLTITASAVVFGVGIPPGLLIKANWSYHTETVLCLCSAMYWVPLMLALYSEGAIADMLDALHIAWLPLSTPLLMVLRRYASKEIYDMTCGIEELRGHRYSHKSL